jgi:hypothetical protein
MKRQIEIDDTLDERVDSAIDEVKKELMSYLDLNKPDELPCLNNDLDYGGAIHEIIDSSVPIYTKEIEDTWYLYSNELEEAYDNAGCGDNPRENDGMSAIYFYIAEKVNEWYQDEAQDIFEEWQAKQVPYKQGDYIRWTDPDDGLCTKEGAIKTIERVDDNTLRITFEDESELEAPENELEEVDAPEEGNKC